MTESVRKRKSKWDLKEETQIPSEIRQDNAWHGKAGEFIRDKELKSGWNSSEVASSHGPKWSDMEVNIAMKSKANSEWSCWESLPGKKGAQKDDSINRDSNDILETTTAWRGDKSYSMSMSSGVDAWRHQNRSRSPKSSWSKSSRSRSRSPPQCFKQESKGWNDRSGSYGVSAQSCRDFAAGRCRRGIQCRFLHQDNQNHEDRKRLESGQAVIRGNRHERGGASRGSSCKYAHHVASADGHGGGSAKEVTREREHVRRDKNASFESDHKREYNRSGSTPCKFFAAGNCRNGEYCSFSHDGSVHVSSDKSRDDRWGPNLDDEIKPWGGPKWDDTNSVFEVTKSSGWSAKFEKLGVPGPMATERSMDDKWVHSFDNKSRKWGGPTWSDKAAERYEHESSQWRIENSDAVMGVPESTGMGKLLDSTDIPSSGANREQHSHQSEKEESGQIPQHVQFNEISLPTREQNITQEISDQQQHVAAVMQPMVSENSYIQQNPSLRRNAFTTFPCEDYDAISNSARSHNEVNFSADIPLLVSVPGQSFNQNGQSFGAQPLSSFNSVGHSGQTFYSNGQVPSNPQSQTLFHQGESIKKPDMVDAKMSQVTSGTPPTQNIVSSEQVAQITNLAASLSQIFGNGQQLPQLYAALNPPSATGLVPSLPNSAGLVSAVPVASIQPNSATWSQFQKQYDPIGESIELSKPDITSPRFSSIPVEQKNVAAGDPQIPLKSFSPSSVSGGPTGGDPYKSVSSEEEPHHESDKFKQLQPVVNCEGKESNEAAEESKKAQEGHSENTETNVRFDEGKRSKDAKGMRTFKFALVEFVKEILKPTWREGQISKEAHKIIVKKVVDKVTGNIQGAHILQTQETIDHYLSYSKPKLTKLVQFEFMTAMNFRSLRCCCFNIFPELSNMLNVLCAERRYLPSVEVCMGQPGSNKSFQ
ncbi:hypothetical protein HHK36_009264 [Tetracentron sinense]|uniref:C3H1-type domain-containing protein n=1 Tax=Tetracentron sinense TaxID=13715 RepID=A0A834ZD47_TETSI|nr:hypothetical protein HHK36_009264 [Tetracentron sinense]